MVKPPSDEQLVTRWRNGEDRAGHTLFARYLDRLHAFFERKCPGEADELVQATFLAYLRTKQVFRGDASFRTYLFTIARHELYRVLRERRRGGERVDIELSSIADLAATPAARLHRSREDARLARLVHQLPHDYRSLVVMHYWEELEIDVLATLFASPAVTIRSRLHRARKLLRELAEQDHRCHGGATEPRDRDARWTR